MLKKTRAVSKSMIMKLYKKMGGVSQKRKVIKTEGFPKTNMY